jgi:hypothetical protein
MLSGMAISRRWDAACERACGSPAKRLVDPARVIGEAGLSTV